MHFSFEQQLRIDSGKKLGLPLHDFADPDYSPDRMTTIIHGLLAGLSKEEIEILRDKSISDTEASNRCFGMRISRPKAS